MVRRRPVLRPRRGLHLPAAAPLPGARLGRRVGIPVGRPRRRRRHGRLRVLPRLRPRARQPRPGAHRSRARLEPGGEPGHVPEREPGGHRPVHRGARLQEPALRAGTEPPLLAAREAGGGRAALPRLPGERALQPGAGVRRGGLGGELRPGHRPGLREAGPRAPPVLVSPRGRDHLPLRQHPSPALRRRARPQGHQHGHRPEAPGRRRPLRLLPPRRRHRPERRLRALEESGDRRDRDLDPPRRGRRQRAPRRGGLRAGRGRDPAHARWPPLEVRDPHRGRLLRLGPGRPGHRARAQGDRDRRHRQELRLQRLVPAARGGALRPLAGLVGGRPDALRLLPGAHDDHHGEARGRPGRQELAPLREPPGRRARRGIRAGVRPGGAAAPVRRAPAGLRGRGPGHPPLPAAVLGRVQLPPVHRLLLGGGSLRDALARTRSRTTSSSSPR